MKYFLMTIIAVFQLNAVSVHADMQGNTKTFILYNGHTINSIDFVIDGPVRKTALARQLKLSAGDIFNAEQWQYDLQLMFNLGFFEKLDTVIHENQDGSLAITLHVKELWSILPILVLMNSSVRVFIIGGQAADTFGEMLEVGGYYMRRDTYNLFRLWAIYPNLITYGSQLEARVIMSGTTVALYPSSPATQEPSLLGSYTSQEAAWKLPRSGYEAIRRGFLLDYGQDIVPRYLKLSTRYLFFMEESFEVTNIQAALDRLNRGLSRIPFQRELMEKKRLSLWVFNASVGSIGLKDNYYYSGTQARYFLVLSQPWLGSQEQFAWHYVDYRGFYRLLPNLDLAVRVSAAHSSSDHPLYQFNLGSDNMDPFVHNQKFPGLLTIRGFRATQFVGHNMYFANIELRSTLFGNIPLWLAGKGNLQVVAFTDVGHIWKDAFFNKEIISDVAVSAGAGLIFTFLSFRYAYVYYYITQTFRPLKETSFNVLLTRPFF